MVPTANNPTLKAQRAASAARHPMSFHTFVPFLELTFGLSWGTIALAILFPAQIEAIFGHVSRSNPLFFLSVKRSSLRRMTFWSSRMTWETHEHPACRALSDLRAGWRDTEYRASEAFTWSMLLEVMEVSHFGETGIKVAPRPGFEPGTY